MLQAADHQPADLRVRGSGCRGAQVEKTKIVGLIAQLPVESRPAFCRDFPFERMPDFVLRLWAELQSNELLGAGPQPAADVVPRDHEIAATIIHATNDQMHMRIVGVPVIDRDPVKPRAKIGFHPPREIAGEPAQVLHLCGILGRDDEAEMMPVVLASCREVRTVQTVGLGIEEQALLPFLADAVAAQIGEMGRERSRTISPALVARDAGSDHDPTR